MKKLLILLVTLAMMFMFTGPVMAGGTADIGGDAYPPVEFDHDSWNIKKGHANGMALGIAGSEIDGDVGVLWGWAGIHGSTASGNFADTGTWTVSSPGVRGVGSGSEAFGFSHTLMDGYAIGIAGFEGDFSGYAFEMTANHSFVRLPPYRLSNSIGETSACAFQMGGGGYEGWIAGGLFGDVEVEALLDIRGGTYVYSERYVFPDGSVSGLWSNASASTLVTSIGDVNRCGLAFGNVNGGYVATGGINLAATQYPNAGGYASANASGQYCGNGGLGSNYYGSTRGYVNTQVTTYTGGSTVYSAAGVDVTSVGW